MHQKMEFIDQSSLQQHTVQCPPAVHADYGNPEFTIQLFERLLEVDMLYTGNQSLDTLILQILEVIGSCTLGAQSDTILPVCVDTDVKMYQKSE